MTNQSNDRFQESCARQLYRNVTGKCEEELHAIALSNPQLFQEWLNDLANQHRRVEGEAERLHLSVERLRAVRRMAMRDIAA